MTQDKTKAFEWYLKAVEGGFVEAMNNVAWCYSNGEGVEKDKRKGFE